MIYQLGFLIKKMANAKLNNKMRKNKDVMDYKWYN